MEPDPGTLSSLNARLALRLDAAHLLAEVTGSATLDLISKSGATASQGQQWSHEKARQIFVRLSLLLEVQLRHHAAAYFGVEDNIIRTDSGSRGRLISPQNTLEAAVFVLHVSAHLKPGGGVEGKACRRLALDAMLAAFRAWSLHGKKLNFEQEDMIRERIDEVAAAWAEENWEEGAVMLRWALGRTLDDIQDSDGGSALQSIACGRFEKTNYLADRTPFCRDPSLLSCRQASLRGFTDCMDSLISNSSDLNLVTRFWTSYDIVSHLRDNTIFVWRGITPSKDGRAKATSVEQLTSELHAKATSLAAQKDTSSTGAILTLYYVGMMDFLTPGDGQHGAGIEPFFHVTTSGGRPRRSAQARIRDELSEFLKFVVGRDRAMKEQFGDPGQGREVLYQGYPTSKPISLTEHEPSDPNHTLSSLQVPVPTPDTTNTLAESLEEPHTTRQNLTTITNALYHPEDGYLPYHPTETPRADCSPTTEPQGVSRPRDSFMPHPLHIRPLTPRPERKSPGPQPTSPPPVAEIKESLLYDTSAHSSIHADIPAQQIQPDREPVPEVSMDVPLDSSTPGQVWRAYSPLPLHSIKSAVLPPFKSFSPTRTHDSVTPPMRFADTPRSLATTASTSPINSVRLPQDQRKAESPAFDTHDTVVVKTPDAGRTPLADPILPPPEPISQPPPPPPMLYYDGLEVAHPVPTQPPPTRSLTRKDGLEVVHPIPDQPPPIRSLSRKDGLEVVHPIPTQPPPTRSLTRNGLEVAHHHHHHDHQRKTSHTTPHPSSKQPPPMPSLSKNVQPLPPLIELASTQPEHRSSSTAPSISVSSSRTTSKVSRFFSKMAPLRTTAAPLMPALPADTQFRFTAAGSGLLVWTKKECRAVTLLQRTPAQTWLGQRLDLRNPPQVSPSSAISPTTPDVPISVRLVEGGTACCAVVLYQGPHLSLLWFNTTNNTRSSRPLGDPTTVPSALSVSRSDARIALACGPTIQLFAAPPRGSSEPPRPLATLQAHSSIHDYTFPSDGGRRIHRLSFSIDGRSLVTATQEYISAHKLPVVVRIWDLDYAAGAGVEDNVVVLSRELSPVWLGVGYADDKGLTGVFYYGGSRDEESSARLFLTAAVIKSYAAIIPLGIEGRNRHLDIKDKRIEVAAQAPGGQYVVFKSGRHALFMMDMLSGTAEALVDLGGDRARLKPHQEPMALGMPADGTVLAAWAGADGGLTVKTISLGSGAKVLGVADADLRSVYFGAALDATR